eukprot:gene36110-43788_t
MFLSTLVVSIMCLYSVQALKIPFKPLTKPLCSRHKETSRLYLLGGFDCDTLPYLADFVYGSKRDIICNSAHYMGQFDEPFDLFGEMFWIGGAVLITALAARMPLVSQTEDDDVVASGMQSCPQCRGKGRFMNKLCSLCDGDGVIETDSTAFFLPQAVATNSNAAFDDTDGDMSRDESDARAEDYGLDEDDDLEDGMGGFGSKPSSKDRDSDDF